MKMLRFRINTNINPIDRHLTLVEILYEVYGMVNRNHQCILSEGNNQIKNILHHLMSNISK